MPTGDPEPVSRRRITGSYASPDGLVRILDKLDDIDKRLRFVEITCTRIETQQDAARSRVSRETKKQDDEDASIEDRVRALEATHAEEKGTSKAMRVLLILAAVLGGGTAGTGASKAVDAITSQDTNR